MSELDQLELKAAALDSQVIEGDKMSPSVPGEPLPSEQPAINQPEQIAAVLTMAVGILSPMFPSVAMVYTPDTINAVAAVTVPLANKRGVNVGAVLGKWTEEVAFAAVVLPLGFATYKAVLHDLEQGKPKGQPAPEKNMLAPQGEKVKPEGEMLKPIELVKH